MSHGLSRRGFVLGSLPVALAAATVPILSSTQVGRGDDRLTTLGRELAILRRRANALEHAYLRLETKGLASARSKWLHWSCAIDDCYRLARAIHRTPATTAAGTIVKLDAAIFELCQSDSQNDGPMRGRLTSLRRDLANLAVSLPP